MNRSWQLGTIQLDFSMPERFELTYVAEDNTEKTPVMIHRAVLGSMERFMGILIEQYAGALPLWLAPEQVRVLTISEKTNEYAIAVQAKLSEAGLRCGIDLSDEKVGAKIAKSHGEKIPYMMVVGPKEAESSTVSVRMRGSQDSRTVVVEQFLAAARQKITAKTADLAL
jgi:threonyl-tRNA synthetase